MNKPGKVIQEIRDRLSLLEQALGEMPAAKGSSASSVQQPANAVEGTTVADSRTTIYTYSVDDDPYVN